MAQRGLGVQGKDPTTWTEDEKANVKQTLEKCVVDFRRFLEETEKKGQNCFVKEHCDFLVDPSAFARFLSPDLGSESIVREELPTLLQGGRERTWSPQNHTLLPDEFLATWKPTFLVRHPALVLPSQFRALGDMGKILGDKNAWDVTMTFNWARKLYSLYADVILKGTPLANDGTTAWPIVLEADDVLSNPAVVRKYCKLVGFDEEKLKFTWDVAAPGDELLRSPIASRMADTLNVSTGILMGKLSVGIDIDVEAVKWREEFGEADGARIEKWVRNAMPDYEFLKARRLTM